MATSRKLPLLALAATALAALLVVGGWLGGDDGHRVTLVVPTAAGLTEGLDLRAAGRPVGTVEEVSATSDRRAKVVLRIQDERVWPLPSDSRFQLRLGGTIKYTDRYVDIRRGRAAGGYPDGATIPADDFVVPTEFDELVGTFDRGTRKGMTGLLRDGGAAIDPARRSLGDALEAAPPTLAQAVGLVHDLGYDTRPLQQLVREGDVVVDAIARSNPGIGQVVQDAAATFDAIGAESAALRSTLEDAPSTLSAVRRTLARADGPLRRTGELLTDLRPGLREASALTGPLEGTLSTLRDVGPDARQTLRSLRVAAPDLTVLLDKAAKLAPTVGSAGREAARQLDCIRPYTPEIAGLISTWGPRTWAFGDGKDKFLRAQVGSYTFGNVERRSTAALLSATPGLNVAFPQPPGFVANQPWFQPRCGITEDSFDPEKDPESGAKELYPKEFYDRAYPDPETGRR